MNAKAIVDASILIQRGKRGEKGIAPNGKRLHWSYGAQRSGAGTSSFCGLNSTWRRIHFATALNQVDCLRCLEAIRREQNRGA